MEEERVYPSKFHKIAEEVFDKLKCSEEETLDYIVKSLQCIELFDIKQHDYGPENIAQFGDIGVLIRLNDKIQRLRTLYLSGDDPRFSGEALEDTWKDIHVYGVIGLMCMQGIWPNAFRWLKRGT